jgi:ribosomal protein L37E
MEKVTYLLRNGVNILSFRRDSCIFLPFLSGTRLVIETSRTSQQTMMKDGRLMKKLPKTPAKRGRPRKKATTKASTTVTQVDKHPRCSRCGSRTVNLEHLEQELLVTLSIHCLICGHHSFIGRPVIRLLKRPNVTIPDSITRPTNR